MLIYNHIDCFFITWALLFIRFAVSYFPSARCRHSDSNWKSFTVWCFHFDCFHHSGWLLHFGQGYLVGWLLPFDELSYPDFAAGDFGCLVSPIAMTNYCQRTFVLKSICYLYLTISWHFGCCLTTFEARAFALSPCQRAAFVTLKINQYYSVPNILLLIS